MMLTDEQIEQAKTEVKYSQPDFWVSQGQRIKRQVVHEHPDCVRMAYQWLDAQRKTKRPNVRGDFLGHSIKHLVEAWCGRYVSQDDVDVAAYLHPQISGKYPLFSISTTLIYPSARRLIGIGEAYKHRATYDEQERLECYKQKEIVILYDSNQCKDISQYTSENQR